MKPPRAYAHVFFNFSAESAEAPPFRSSSFGGSDGRIHQCAYPHGLLRRRINRGQLSSVHSKGGTEVSTATPHEANEYDTIKSNDVIPHTSEGLVLIKEKPWLGPRGLLSRFQPSLLSISTSTTEVTPRGVMIPALRAPPITNNFLSAATTFNPCLPVGAGSPTSHESSRGS